MVVSLVLLSSFSAFKRMGWTIDLGNNAARKRATIPIKKMGANAWNRSDARKSPFSNSETARLKPQPGQGIPVACRIGHSQDGSFREVKQI
jgi:hypothetical protein